MTVGTPPLILVSAFFFGAVCSLLYLLAWGVSFLFTGLFHRVLPARVMKSFLMGMMLAPPLLALALTLSGAMLDYTVEFTTLQHHSIICMDAFGKLDRLAPSAPDGRIAGALINGGAWLLLLAGIALSFQKLLATHRLECAITPALDAPSPALRQAIGQVAGRYGRLNSALFFECGIPPNYSGVVGIHKPRCVLSKELVALADPQELEAVVAHEASHLRAGDLYQSLVIEMLGAMFFYLRPARLLVRSWREQMELACDADAVALTQRPLALAGAILRASGVPAARRVDQSTTATATHFADEQVCSCARRIEKLLADERAFSTGADDPTGGGNQRVAPLNYQALMAWIFTVALGSSGIAAIFSGSVACYAHCSLEAIARLLP